MKHCSVRNPIKRMRRHATDRQYLQNTSLVQDCPQRTQELLQINRTTALKRWTSKHTQMTDQ